MLKIRDLHKRYGEVVALDGVDLDVEPGEILALLGPNGAGKTTLVSIVAGLRRPDSGTVEVGGIDAIAHPARSQRLIGLAPQDTGLYPIATVWQNLALFGRIAGLRGTELEERIAEVAEALHITDLLERKAGTLSGGQKRRLHTAMALVHRPPLLLLDEATTGADVNTRQQLLDLIRDLASSGSAVLYSTHYLHEVEDLGGSVAIVQHGKVIAAGQTTELIETHGSSAVELAFDGTPPHLDEFDAVLVSEDTLRINNDRPAQAAAEVLRGLGPDGARLRSVEIVRESLETVYLNLTGHRFADDDLEGEHVAIS